MFELAASGLLGSILGGLFRMAPEILKYVDRKDERKHELNMFTLQTDLEKIKGTQKLEGHYIDYGIAQTNAIQEAFKSQSEEAGKSYKWVSAISALVRPSITYILFAMYVIFKFTMISYAFSTGTPLVDIVKTNWTADDFAMLNMILTFWFLGRPLEKPKS